MWLAIASSSSSSRLRCCERRAFDAIPRAVANRNERSLPPLIVDSFCDAVQKTCCAASSIDAAGTPSPRSERQMKS